MSLDRVIFKNKTYSDLLSEIYDNSAKTRKQLKDLISELTKLVTTPAEAQRLVPLIREYMEIGIKNDDQLVKLATIIQRLETARKEDTVDIFGELQSLLEADQQLDKQLPEPPKA
jgi:hypothetical protein